MAVRQSTRSRTLNVRLTDYGDVIVGGVTQSPPRQRQRWAGGDGGDQGLPDQLAQDQAGVDPGGAAPVLQGVHGHAAPAQQGGAPPHQVAAPVLLDGVQPIQPVVNNIHHAVPPVPLPRDPQQQQPLGPDLDEREDLGPWLNPVIPGPILGPLPDDGDGWNRIDQLGVWECGLSTIRTMEQVPNIFREKWARAVSTILSRLQQASTPEEETRALKLLLIYYVHKNYGTATGF